MTVWFTARGAGLSTLLLLSMSTALGAVMTGRGTATGRVIWHYVHRITASLGLGILLLHVATILADPYADVGWKGAIIPVTAGYRPTWVGLGTMAVYTCVLVAAVGFVRGRFASTPKGSTLWRRLHSLAYLGWGMAMWHGFLSGSDSGVAWVRWLYIVCGAGVLSALTVRFTRVARPGLARHAAPAAQQLVGGR